MHDNHFPFHKTHVSLNIHHETPPPPWNSLTTLGSAGEYGYNKEVSKGEYGTHTEGRDHITPPPLDDTTVRRGDKVAGEEASPLEKQTSEEPVEEELKHLVEDPAPEPGSNGC